MNKRNQIKTIQIKLYDEEIKYSNIIENISDKNKYKGASIIQSILTTLTLKIIIPPFRKFLYMSSINQDQTIKQEQKDILIQTKTNSSQNIKYNKLSKNRSLNFLKQYTPPKIKQAQSISTRLTRIQSTLSTYKKQRSVSNSIKKLENLRKNICKQKNEELKKFIQKKQQKQMVMILQELKNLRAQVKQVKLINQKLKTQNQDIKTLKKSPLTDRSSFVQTQMSSVRSKSVLQSNFDGCTSPQFYQLLKIPTKKQNQKFITTDKKRSTQYAKSQKKDNNNNRSSTPKITFKYISPSTKLNIKNLQPQKFVSNDCIGNNIGWRKIQKLKHADFKNTKKNILNQACYHRNQQSKLKNY